MTPCALAALLVLAGCAPPMALGSLDLSAAIEPPDAIEPSVDGDAADALECPPDLVLVMHFYPELQRQVERYHCAGCHSGAVPAPQLVVGDTALAGRNYLALRDFAAPPLLTKLANSAHCGSVCVPAADLVSWARWIAAPVP
jgi:hypothetical protein